MLLNVTSDAEKDKKGKYSMLSMISFTIEKRKNNSEIAKKYQEKRKIILSGKIYHPGLKNIRYVEKISRRYFERK